MSSGPSLYLSLTFVLLVLAGRLCEVPNILSSQLPVECKRAQLVISSAQVLGITNEMNLLSLGHMLIHEAVRNARYSALSARPGPHVHPLSPTGTTWGNKRGVVHKENSRNCQQKRGQAKTASVQDSIVFTNLTRKRQRKFL